MLQNVFVYLVGFSGTGKYTIAQELAKTLAARVVDNHWINNPIFGLLDNDRLTPFPDAVWDQVDKVRQAVLDTIATLSTPGANFILTHAGYEGDPDDHGIYRAIATAAERRRALFIPVRLLCAEAELVRRVVSPGRAGKLKGMDPNAASRDARGAEVLRTGHAHELTLDTSVIAPEESARRILRHIEACAAG